MKQDEGGNGMLERTVRLRSSWGEDN